MCCEVRQLKVDIRVEFRALFNLYVAQPTFTILTRTPQSRGYKEAGCGVPSR